MKFSILSTLSVVACIFSSFAVASPVASTSLAARDATADTIIGHITTIKTNLDACHTKWKTTCSSKCSTGQVTSWAKECGVIITTGANDCKKAIPSGWTCPQASITIIISILASIWILIIDALNFLLGKCGLLTGLLTLLLGIVGGLIVDLTIALKLLLSVLGVCIPGLVGLLLAAVTALLGTILGCLICTLSGLLSLLCL